MKPSLPNEQTHFLCERCGGTGRQEAGLWNPDRKRHDDPAGTCRACHGSGYLGLLPPLTRLISQSDLADVLTHEGIIDYDAIERPEDYDGGTTELQVSIAAREIDRIARENAKGQATKLAEALECLIKANEEHNAAIMAIIGRPTGWTDGYLEPARTALAEWKQINQPTTKS